MQSMTISVVIPAYNAETYIARSIDSVLNQARPVDEIIVVDDGSADATAEIIKRYGEKVRYIHQPNAGVSAARNAGIQAATGDWIAFLDADDEWLPEKIKLQTEQLARNPDLVWTTGNYIECLCDEKRSAEHTPASQCLRYQKNLDYYDSYFRAVELCQWGHTDCMLIQRNVFDEVGMFNAHLPVAEDQDLWLRIAYRYPKVGFLPQPLVIYHIGVPDSLMRAYRPESLHVSFIDRHLRIAQAENMLDAFQPAAAFMMRRWVRGMLFEGRKAEIRESLNRFPILFSFFYRRAVYLLTIFPTFTAGLCHGLSRFIRFFRLRRKVVRKPSKRLGE